MAERGKPLSFNIREQIKAARAESTVRATAAAVGVSKTTVQKYARTSLVQNSSMARDNR